MHKNTMSYHQFVPEFSLELCKGAGWPERFLKYLRDKGMKVQKSCCFRELLLGRVSKQEARAGWAEAVERLPAHAASQPSRSQHTFFWRP